ncbi:MAG TPA: L,D-transpeptidase family protein [Allosphingosinicella sp.]|jgi:lipoprotein-anchoring transpeptidase ErfK/SrfK|nr:L,D-transpeptidase family protein [Allosphingosinicella sp.]
MKFGKSFFVRTSIVALTLGALPVASAAMQPSAAPADAAIVQPAAPPVVPAAPSPAEIAQMRAQTQLAADAADLDAGEFVWRPELAPAGNVEVVVSIPQQRAYIYRANRLIGVTTVSTGRPGHRTPTGRFPIMEKHRTHFSSIYDNAPMPFMQRLTMGGIALHAGVIPGYAASHGCVRLPYEMARNLFGATQVRTVVHIVAGSPTPLTALQIARGERPAAPLEQPVRGTR